MVDIKVRLSFTIPGAVRLSAQECAENPKESYDTFRVAVDSRNGSKVTKDIIKVRTRKAKPAKQAIMISREAYQYMVSDEGRLSAGKFPLSKWQHMGKMQRLDTHMRAIAESLGGKDPVYEVLDD